MDDERNGDQQQTFQDASQTSGRSAVRPIGAVSSLAVSIDWSPEVFSHFPRRFARFLTISDVRFPILFDFCLKFFQF